MKPAPLILGLDAGGTKTHAALADDSGRILRVACGAGLDPTVGNGWQHELVQILATLAPGKISAAVLGMPFHGEIAAISANQIAVSQHLIDGPVRVMNDVAIAFEGAFAGGNGVLILAGTGSMGWTQRAANISVRVGGWGGAFGDEGSAYAIGVEALRITSWHLDGRAYAPDFATAILHHLGISEDGLIDWAYGSLGTRSAVAELAKTVSDLAENDNVEACNILKKAADHLTVMAQTAAQKAGLVAPFSWAYAGGVFQSTLMRGLVSKSLGQPAVAALSPLGGALLAAARLAGWQTGPDWMQRLGHNLALQRANLG